MSLEEIDALLADLQSSVSGPTHSPGPRVHPPPSVSHHQSPTTAYAHSSPVSYTHRSPGPQPHHNGEFRHNPDSITHYANGDVDTNPQKKVYYQESKEEVRTESRSSGPNPAPEPKTDELESLLSELNSSRYTGIVDRSSGAMAQPASAGRPSVDYLLNELNSVNSTSRTTTSQNHMPSNHMPSNPPLAASTATRDLDDLMAELSDIKEDRSWVSALEDQVESEDHPERVGATTAQSSQKTAMSTFQSTKTSQNSTSKTTKGSSKSSHGLAFKAMQDSGFKSPQGSKSPKPPRTPPPRPPTPRNVATPPPRPPAPADIGAPLVLPCPDTPPPIPPPPAAINASPTTTLNRKTPVVAEPFERPDSGGPVKRNDAAYRWITDEIKYEIRAVQDEPEEEPPIIPEPQNDKLRSPALVRKLLNRTDTYAKPQKPRSPSPAPPPPPPAVKDPSPPAVNELDCMLGSLTTHMTEQGVNTHNKGSCCACDKPIVGQVITALGKTWHPEHFKCGHCKQELGSKNFFERDGKPYCEACYHELFSPRCAYCGGAILDKCVTALDKNWHPDHFFCAQCGNTFGEEGFHEKDGKAYCREDYYNMFAPKCGGCNSPIMENYISALNAQWHPECFVCRDCRQPFNGGSFFDHEGLPYCETHYHAKRGSLCYGCHKPITGRCVTAMFRKYHPEHFTCSFCMSQLNKGTFKEQNDKPYCHACFEKLFG